jgi:hypothetical protein
MLDKTANEVHSLRQQRIFGEHHDRLRALPC